MWLIAHMFPPLGANFINRYDLIGELYIFKLFYHNTAMKFLIDNTEKTGKQVRSAPINEQRRKDGTNYYYNIVNPSNKIQCDECKRDISKSTKVLSDEFDYCVSCFSNLEEYPSEYHVINKLDYPLYDSEWTAEEDLLLFEGLEKHGFGNWAEIADFIGSNKTRVDVEEHYLTFYLETPDYLPTTNLITRRDSTGKLVKTTKDGPTKKSSKPIHRNNCTNSVQSFQRGSLTVNQLTNNIKTNSNPAEIVGFLPKRGDFEVEYDNDAELLLAQMEFNDDDSEEEKKMKFRLIDIYNHKLTERIRRKQFVISRKLLDLKQQMRLDKNRTKEQKEIYNMMKVFARFSTADEHEKLVQGIIKEKQIRQRLEELKDLKRKGFRTISEAEDEIQSKKRKDERNSKKKEDLYVDKSKTRRMRNSQIIEKAEKRSAHLTKEEEDLCKRFNINHKQYMMIKETIIRESIKQGIIERDETAKIFRIERNVVDGVFDFLVEKDEIFTNAKESDYYQ